jgi:hypothetical protein
VVVPLQLALFSRLSNEVLARRAAKRYDAESMALAGKLLEHNPEVYTVWNYRREALEDTFLVSFHLCIIWLDVFDTQGYLLAC